MKAWCVKSPTGQFYGWSIADNKCDADVDCNAMNDHFKGHKVVQVEITEVKEDDKE